MSCVGYVFIPFCVTALFVGCPKRGVHIGVGFSVARSDWKGNARASDCGTSRQVSSHAFFVYVPIPI